MGNSAGEVLKLHVSGRPARGAAKGGQEPFDLNSLAWPSGRGDEVGVVHTDLETLWQTILLNGRSLRHKDLTAVQLREGDMRAIMLHGLKVGPISFVCEPQGENGTLAIIADAGAVRASVEHQLQALLVGLDVLFQH